MKFLPMNKYEQDLFSYLSGKLAQNQKNMVNSYCCKPCTVPLTQSLVVLHLLGLRVIRWYERWQLPVLLPALAAHLQGIVVSVRSPACLSSSGSHKLCLRWSTSKLEMANSARVTQWQLSSIK